MTQLVLHISCLNLCVVLWCCHVWAIGAGAAIPWIGHRGSSAALPKAQNQAVGADFANTSLEHPTGLNCHLGYQMMATPLSPSLRWFVCWHLAPPVVLCHGADVILCGRVWSGCAVSPLLLTPVPSSLSSGFGLVLSAGCQGGEVPCGGCQLLSWHTYLGQLPALLQQSKTG